MDLFTTHAQAHETETESHPVPGQSRRPLWFALMLFTGMLAASIGTTWLALSVQRQALEAAIQLEVPGKDPSGHEFEAQQASVWTPQPNAEPAATALAVQSLFPLYSLRLQWQPFAIAAAIHLLIAGAIVLVVRRLYGAATRESQLAQFNAILALEIDERKRVEAALRTANDAAQKASRTKTEFLASMSHELRTPLNAILGFSDILRTGLFGPLGDARYQDYAKDIHQSGRHLLDLINDILDISKIEARRADLREADLEIERSVRSCLRMMRQHTEAQDLDIVLDIAQDLPQLHADRRVLKQILLNLLSNATKFTPPGGRIVLSATTVEDGGVRISISDTGVGMSPEEIPLALEPFGQTLSGRQLAQEGTGLGLALAKLMVEQHGGRFRLESRLGEGTTATIDFPAERSRPAMPIARSA